MRHAKRKAAAAAPDAEICPYFIDRIKDGGRQELLSKFVTGVRGGRRFAPMIGLLSYLTASAVISGAGEAGKFVWQSAASGLIGNTFHNAVWRAVPEVQRWYRGEGQPVNHHMQRAFRAAYLGATGQLLRNEKSEAPGLARKGIDDDTAVWCDQALGWVKAQSDLLTDERYQPPAPPGGWDPAHVVEPRAIDAAAEVSALRDSLVAMLISEWAAGGLRGAPESVVKALREGWRETDADGAEQKANWFDLISVYFAHEIKSRPEVQAIFVSTTVSRILMELRGFRREFEENHLTAATPPPDAFFAPPPADFFVGREAALAALAKRLAGPGRVAPLTGMAGLGKTSLALAFAHEYRGDFEGVYWVNCAGRELAASAAELAAQLKCPPEAEPEAQLREIRVRCEARHCLLVLDNVELDEFGGIVPGGRCAVLVTSRRRDLPFLQRYRETELETFTPGECLDLFREHLPASEVADKEAGYLKLAERLGRLPLAVAVAAGLLRSDIRYSLDRLLNEPRPHKLKNGDLDISGLLSAAIGSVDEPARRLLRAMAVCAAAGFRVDLAAEIAGMDQVQALDALQDLRSRSLADVIDRESVRCRLHLLIRSEAGQEWGTYESGMRRRWRDGFGAGRRSGANAWGISMTGASRWRGRPRRPRRLPKGLER